MPSIELDDQEWQQVMSILSTAPWRDANPLLMKIGNQLRIQQGAGEPSQPIRRTGDGKEVRHE